MAYVITDKSDAISKLLNEESVLCKRGIDNLWIIPEALNIEKIYRGYRQCYSKYPFKDSSIKDSEIKVLKEKLEKEILHHVKAWGLNSGNCLNNECTSSEYVSRAFEMYGYDQLIRHLHKCLFISKHMNHESPLEHGVVTYQISNLDRKDSHQVVRSRIASFSQQSQRYVDFSDEVPFNPDQVVRNNPEAMEIFERIFGIVSASANKLTEMGLSSDNVRGIYPNNTVTELICTMNYRELIHVFNERCCALASDRYRHMANDLLSQMRSRIPFIFNVENGIGAKCEKYHICPESKERSCGKYPNIDQVKYYIDTHRTEIEECYDNKID